MKILIVEDQQEARNDIAEELGLAVPKAELEFATSRDGALELLESAEYDLIVCDLRIPAADGELDAQEVHGMVVHATAREARAGVPLIFFTGRGTVQNTAHALSTGGTADLFGSGAEALVRIFEKDRMLAFVERVGEMERGYAVLHQMPITGIEALEVGVAEMLHRAVAIYGRPKDAVHGDVQVLRGFSGAAVGRVKLTNAGGAVVASIFVKVGDRGRIEDERRRYVRYVGGTLSLNTFAPEAGSVLHNLRSRGALFYHLAEEYEASLFDLLASTPNEAPAVLSRIRKALEPWHSNQVTRSLTVGNQRRQRISDARCGERGVDLQFAGALEAETLNLVVSVQHGDLHAGNVLINEAHEALLIDFGDVGWAPRILDAVMLEFSLLFHPDSPAKGSDWPTKEQAENWWDLESYLEGCPAPDFVRGCRAWATEVDSSMLAPVVYVHAARQLKYDDVDPELALSIARGAVALSEAATPGL